MPYVGVDRRRPTPEGGADRTRERAQLLALLLVCSALGVLLLLQERLTALSLAVDVERLAAVVAVVGAVVALVRWMLTGEAAAVLLGAALLAVGSGAVLLSPLAVLLHTDPELVALAPLPHALATLPALALVVRALRTPVVDSSLRPAGVVLGPATVLLATALLLVLLAAPLRDTLPAAAVAAVNGVVAVAWTASAVASRRAEPLRRVLPQVTVVLALLALADLVRVAAAAAPGWLNLVAAGTDLSAAALTVASLSAGLSGVMRQGGSESMQLLVRLHAAERQMRHRAEDDEARRHDVRATLAGVRAALTVSDRYGADEPQELHRAVVAELSRLEQQLGAQREEQPREVVLAELLAPVLATERAQGVALHADLGQVRAVVAPAGLTGAVQNLLANVRRHAPGAAVTVSAERAGEVVRLVVADDGPGVLPAHRDLVLVRGVHSPVGGGQGHGLANAAAAAALTGGALHVEERDGGGAAFVLTLPAGGAGRASA